VHQAGCGHRHRIPGARGFLASADSGKNALSMAARPPRLPRLPARPQCQPERCQCINPALVTTFDQMALGLPRVRDLRSSTAAPDRTRLRPLAACYPEGALGSMPSVRSTGSIRISVASCSIRVAMSRICPASQASNFRATAPHGPVSCCRKSSLSSPLHLFLPHRLQHQLHQRPDRGCLPDS